MFKRTKKAPASSTDQARSGLIDVSGFVPDRPAIQIAVELGSRDATVHLAGSGFQQISLAALATVTLVAHLIQTRLDSTTTDDQDPAGPMFWRKVMTDGSPAALNDSLNPDGIRVATTPWEQEQPPHFYATATHDPDVGSAAFPNFGREVDDREILRAACALYAFVDHKGAADIVYLALRALEVVTFNPDDPLVNIFVLPDAMLATGLDLHTRRRSRTGADPFAFTLTTTTVQHSQVASQVSNKFTLVPDSTTDIVDWLVRTMIEKSQFGDWIPIAHDGDGGPTFKAVHEVSSSQRVEFEASLDDGWDPFLAHQAATLLLSIWSANHYEEVTANIDPEALARIRRHSQG